MGKKRYVDIGVEWIDGFIQDHEDDNDLFGIGTVINLLNEQDKEIKSLKKENKLLKEENQKLMKAVSESSRMAVETLLPKDVLRH